MKKNTQSAILNPSLRVLMVEDSEDDALLIIRTLKKGGYNPLYERVKTVAAMKKTLKEKQWDIILCDYKLPKFDAPSAIAELKKTNIDTPIIIVSGTVDEDVAIECMRLGAHDYIMKNNLSRLCPAIARELKETEVKNKQKQAELQRWVALEELRQSEEKHRTILENIEDGYYEVDLIGNLLFFNDSLCRIHGYPREELRGMTNRHYADKENAKIIFKAFNKVFKTGEPLKGFEWQIIRKDGTKRDIEQSASLIKDSTGKPIGFRGITRDITERKQNEGQREAALKALRKSEELYTKLVDTIPDSIIRTNLEGKILFVNDYTLQISGYSRKEIVGQNILTFVSPEEHENMIENISLMMKSGLGPREYNLIMKGGRKITFEVNGEVLRNEDGTPFGLVSVCRDISERKRTERILRENEERLRAITKNLPGIIFRSYAKDSGEYGLIYISERATKTLGVTPHLDDTCPNVEDILPLFLARLHEEDRDGYLASMKKAVETETSWNFEGRLFTVASGEMVWFQATAIPTRHEDQLIFDGIILNITERKLAEEKSRLAERILRENEEHLRAITKNLPGLIFQFYAKDSGESGISYASEPLTEFSKIVSKMDQANMESLFPLFISYLHEEDRDRFLTSIKTAVETETSWNFEGRIALPSGKVIWFQGLSTPTRQEDQLVFDGILLNITERKQAEEMSRHSEEKFHKIFITTPDCIAITRLKDGILIDVNKGFEEMLGWKRDEIIGIRSTDRSFNFWVDPSARELMVADLKAGGDVHHREVEFRRSDGSLCTGIYSARSIQIDGEACIIFILQDITERKQTEEKLHQTLNSLRKAVSTTIQVMISAVERRDPYTAGHQIRCADVARAIATEMGLPLDKIDGIRLAGSIHDIGKLSLPAEILSKPTKLTTTEFSLIKEHALTGHEILKDVESPWLLDEMIYQHHERMDGSGYPRKLKGDEIILEARILAVADVVESMASHRPYRPALGIDAALEEIEKNKGILYDEAVADACLRIFREKQYQIPL